MEELYFIYQFVIFEDKDYYAVQNSKALNLITDIRIKKFFNDIETDNRLSVSKKYMEYYFGDDTSDIIKYLLDSKLIYTTPTKVSYKDIVVFSNEERIAQSLLFNTNGSTKHFNINYERHTNDLFKQIKRGMEDSVYARSSLFCVILNPFDYRDFVKINTFFQENDLCYMFVFAYNNSYYITNVHKKSWYNPCPKCFFSQLESGLRSYNKNTSQITFQTIVDLLYANNVVFNPQNPTSSRSVLKLVSEIVEYDVANLSDVVNRVISINDAEIKYDQAIHWELCDCFE